MSPVSSKEQRQQSEQQQQQQGGSDISTVIGANWEWGSTDDALSYGSGSAYENIGTLKQSLNQSKPIPIEKLRSYISYSKTDSNYFLPIFLSHEIM